MHEVKAIGQYDEGSEQTPLPLYIGTKIEDFQAIGTEPESQHLLNK